MAKRLSYLLFTCMLLSLTSVFGQDSAIAVTETVQQQNTETGPVNEFFRSNDKIYVVVGLLVIIFIFIVLYLVRLDKRLSKLEKE